MESLLTDGLWPDTRRFVPDSAINVIRGNAAYADQDARIPDENIRVLRESRFFSAIIPTQLGGGGASFLECVAMQRRVGQIDAGLAIGLTMHLHSACLVRLLTSAGIRDFSEFLRDASAHQYIICSGGAEAGLGGSVCHSSFATQRCPDGYRISGKKAPLSLARVGDFMIMQFPDPASEHKEVMWALIPLRTPGVTIEKTWDTLGARSSESDTVTIQNLFVPDHMSIRPAQYYNTFVEVSLVWYCVLITATYLGVATEVLQQSKNILTSPTLYTKRAARGSLVSFQTAFAEIAARVLALECACVKVAEHTTHVGDNVANCLPYAMSLKYAAVDICRDVVARSAELVGGASFYRGSELARALRDIHAFPIHAPNRIMTLQILGRLLLGMTFDLDYQEYPSTPCAVPAR